MKTTRFNFLAILVSSLFGRSKYKLPDQLPTLPIVNESTLPVNGPTSRLEPAAKEEAIWLDVEVFHPIYPMSTQVYLDGVLQKDATRLMIGKSGWVDVYARTNGEYVSVRYPPEHPQSIQSALLQGREVWPNGNGPSVYERIHGNVTLGVPEWNA